MTLTKQVPNRAIYRNTCFYMLGGTTTFRRASKSILGIWGTNLQNPSKRLCGLYEADPGKLLCQVDQSGAEALIVSYLCRKANYRDLFLNKVKPHSFLAMHGVPHIWEAKFFQQNAITDDCIQNYLNAKIADLPKMSNWKALASLIASSDNWDAQERYYYIYKMVCHSSNYGITPPTLQLNILEKSGGTIVLTKKKAEEFLFLYFSLFPEILEWQNEVREQLKNSRTLYNLQGFPREFTGQMNSKFWKEGFSFIPQSTVGCITMNAIITMQNYIEDNLLDWDILNDKHDSYLIQAPEAEIEHCARKAKEFMEQELTSPRGEVFNMRAEAQVGRNWQPYSKKNPDGLKEIKL